MKKVTGLSIIFIFILFAFKSPEKEKINWISFETLAASYEKEPRPILIDVYTNWCGWCKEMDRTTYKNAKLAAYLNQHYYSIKLNAESSESFIFNKKKYTAPELAQMLMFGNMSYPTTVFLPAVDAKPAPLPGYMKAAEMEAPIRYFGDGAYRTKTFVDFNKEMKSSW